MLPECGRARHHPEEAESPIGLYSSRPHPRRIRHRILERMTEALKSSLTHWPELSRSVFVPHTEAEYDSLVSLLDELVDEVGNDDSHAPASLMEIIGFLVEKYEDEHVPELENTGLVREEPPAL